MKLLFLCLTTIALLLGVACSAVPSESGEPTPIENPTVDSTEKPTATQPTAPLAVVDRLREALARETGLAATDLTLQQAEAREWSDSCLGAGQANELCAQVITPGYRLVFATPQGDAIVHSDSTGASYRLVSP